MGMATNPVFLPGELHGPRSWVGYNPQGRQGLDMTDLQVSIPYRYLLQGQAFCFHFFMMFIGLIF